jgi:hypothetical protein
MFAQLNRPNKALEEYEANLKKHPNRFNALYGAAVSAEKSADIQRATAYYQQLATMVEKVKSNRVEVQKAREYVKLALIK